MVGSQLLPVIWSHVKKLGAPTAILLQVGENDLGSYKGLDVIVSLRAVLDFLWDSFPGLTIIWSDLLERRFWRHASDPRAVDKARRKVNKVIGREIVAHGGLRVHHPYISHKRAGLYLRDGVHLSAEGNAIWIKDIQFTVSYWSQLHGSGGRRVNSPHVAV